MGMGSSTHQIAQRVVTTAVHMAGLLKLVSWESRAPTTRARAGPSKSFILIAPAQLAIGSWV